MVLDPQVHDVTDVSLIGYEFSGAGIFSGPVDGVVLSGAFMTNPIESTNHPDIPIPVNPSTETIDFVLTQIGAFDARSEFGPVSGRFTIVAELTLVLGNASDALAVIFGLYADSLVSEGEQESLFAIDKIATDRTRVDLCRYRDMDSLPNLSYRNLRQRLAPKEHSRWQMVF